MSRPNPPVHVPTFGKGFREARISSKWLILGHVMRLSPEAFRLYGLALLWSVNAQTDGLLDDELFDDIGRLDRIGVDELEQCGLWVRQGVGWLITDFAMTQVTSRRAASRRARQARANERRAVAELVDTPDEQISDGETHVYRWYDIDGRLLYVGITNDLEVRRSYHRAFSAWVEFAVTEKVETYPTRGIARGVEAAAIVAERPLFNHVHQDTPDARERFVRYLVEKERFDLLAPAVARGRRESARASREEEDLPQPTGFVSDDVKDTEDWPVVSVPGQRQDPDPPQPPPSFAIIDRMKAEADRT